MNTIIVKHTHTGSFNSTARICRLAKQQGVEVLCFIIDRWVSAKPGDDAVSVYRQAFNEDYVAGVKHDERSVVACVGVGLSAKLPAWDDPRYLRADAELGDEREL